MKQNKKTRSHNTSAKHRTLRVETLEDRCMLSVTLGNDVSHHFEPGSPAHVLQTEGVYVSDIGRTIHYDAAPDQALLAALRADFGDSSGGASGGVQHGLADTFLLHSNPGASKVIYLDFNGHTTSGTDWNIDFTSGADFTTPAYSYQGGPTFTDAELTSIQRIWEQVAEDFLPFNVDVTTEDPGASALINSGGGDQQYGVRVVIGGSYSDWFGPSAGGVAYLYSFTDSVDTPAFVFGDVSFPGDEKSVAEAISHEAGHTLGLRHDGDNVFAYYDGHGSGPTGWAPIMGVGYYQELVQWSRGEYTAANNTEDDLSIITSGNGFGYRADDHGSSIATASALTTPDGTFVSGEGIIERNTDVDYFSFSTGVGQVVFDINPFHNSPNLDILATIYDSAGAVVATSNPGSALFADFAVTLAAGDYYLAIEGTGKDTPATGYSDYGSLGYYSITGTVVFDDGSIDGDHFWSTYLGGSQKDQGFGASVDADGYTYVTGQSWSSDWPYPGVDRSHAGFGDAFISKVDSLGEPLWVTYLGGSSWDYGHAVVTDANGDVYVAGKTESAGWITGSLDTTHGGGEDGFVAKISSAGDLLWATYLGGANNDSVEEIAIDASGNLVVAGSTASAGWIAGGADNSYNGGGDAFVAKLASNGQVLWSTYAGGAQFDHGFDVTFDASGNVILVGQTQSNFWISGGYDTSYAGEDGFVAKYDSSGDFLWSSYLGAAGVDIAYGVAVDSARNIFVAGETGSSGWVSGGYDTTYGGGRDAFVAKLSSTGAHVWSTYLGGDDLDIANGIAVDAAGNPIVVGKTESTAWVGGAFDSSHNGAVDGFVVLLTSSGGHDWSTYFGGSSIDDAQSIALESDGNVLVTGFTTSAGWAKSGYDTSYNGLGDSFVLKIGHVAAIVATPGDFDADGDVDGDDFLAWQGGFGITSGATTADGDGDGDGDVDGDDFLVWQSNFGSGAGAASSAVVGDAPQSGASRIGAPDGTRLVPSQREVTTDRIEAVARNDHFFDRITPQRRTQLKIDDADRADRRDSARRFADAKDAAFEKLGAGGIFAGVRFAKMKT